MRLTVNGETGDWPVRSLGDLVAEFLIRAGQEPEATVATAWNRLFVGKRQRAALLLSEDDEVEILVPMQGG